MWFEVIFPDGWKNDERFSCIKFLLKMDRVRIIRDEQFLRKDISKKRNEGLDLLFRTILPQGLASEYIGKYIKWHIKSSVNSISLSKSLIRKYQFWTDKEIFEHLPKKERERRLVIPFISWDRPDVIPLPQLIVDVLAGIEERHGVDTI